MSRKKSIRGNVKQHKLVAILMGACIVILLIHRMWQEGVGSMIAALGESFK